MPWQTHMQRLTMTLTEFLRARFDEDEDRAAIDENIGHISGVGYRRAMAEVEAKRRIVDIYVGIDPEYTLVQRLLALPYADHPDYRDEWRP